MYVEHIVQQVQYKFYVWFHQRLPLSLACRILVHGNQSFHESNLVIMQLNGLHMSFHGILFTIIVSDVCDFLAVLDC